MFLIKFLHERNTALHRRIEVRRLHDVLHAREERGVAEHGGDEQPLCDVIDEVITHENFSAFRVPI